MYEVIVIGGGHAGCEAALASARRGLPTLLITMNLDTIAKPSCNPAVGGIGKGHLVRELDALGGAMGWVTDGSAIQYRMLNRARGPAVQAPRAQIDRWAYHLLMKKTLEETPLLSLFQASVEKIVVEENVVKGVLTQEGLFFPARSIVLCSGTFLQGSLFFGIHSYGGGRAGDPACSGISHSLKELGFNLGRFKTGTPPRLDARSICTDTLEEQCSEPDIRFSFRHNEQSLPKISCYITYTTHETQAIAREHLHQSAIYSGTISSRGPRYCPSFEDKVVRFANKERHQLFLEPEGLHATELYVNGLSTSLPYEVQEKMIHSIPGLEKAIIIKPGYAIEYDYATYGQIDPTMETKSIRGLFFAGQINGTTGYEEAAVQGFIAGINAAHRVLELPYFYPTREESYIGVVLDDLTTKPLIEPYRIFTSRAEYRLLLRQDNAALRLMHYGYQLGLISHDLYQQLQDENRMLQDQEHHLQTVFVSWEGATITLAHLLRRPEIDYPRLRSLFPEHVRELPSDLIHQLTANIKYAGYIARQAAEIEKVKKAEHMEIPPLDYTTIEGLGTEAKSMLQLFTPKTIGQASRIPGMTPADLYILMIAIEKFRANPSTPPS